MWDIIRRHPLRGLEVPSARLCPRARGLARGFIPPSRPGIKSMRVLLLLFLTLPIFAEDWPEFRGPTGQGLSYERGLPLTWSESRHIAWKTDVPGSGWSSPVVSGGRVWLTTAIEGRGTSLRVIAF